jgi:hypothetical protein
VTQYKDPVKVAFDVVIQDADQGGAFVEFPHRVEEMFGVKGRAPVRATFDGVDYRGSMVRMGTECHLLLILKAIRQQIGKSPGDTVHVTVALDNQVRKIELPKDAHDALTAAGVSSGFEQLSFSHQREYAVAIQEAKRPETRQRRIESMVETLRGPK